MRSHGWCEATAIQTLIARLPTKRHEPRDQSTRTPGAARSGSNRTWRRLPGRAAFRRDGLAGLNGAISNVPDGMANAILVGVNPLYDLYATMVGPLVGGIFSSTRLMVITATAAASLTAGQALAQIPADARENALFLMVVLVGAFQLFSAACGWTGSLSLFPIR